MRFLPTACALAALAFVLVSGVSATKDYPHVPDMTFAEVKTNPQQRLVIFFFGSDEAAVPMLDMVESTAEYLESLNLAKLKDFHYAKVDCEAEANKAECDEAGFKTAGIWIFTSTPHEGIQSFGGTRDAYTLSNHIRHKFLPTDEKDVLPFEDENALFERLDKDGAKPIIMKFWESWCTHCKHLKRPYEQAAGFFKGEVEFFEVECSKNEKSKAFCQSSGISSYPTLILYDGEKKTKYDQADKSIASFQNFFLANLPAERYTKVEDKELAGLPPPPGKPSGEEKPRPAAGSGDEKAKRAAKKADEPKKTATKKRSDDDEEDEAPRKKQSQKQRRRRDDDDDEDDAPRRRRRSRRDDDDDEDDEAPRRRRRRAPARRRRDDDEDDEDEAPRKKKKAAKKPKKAQRDEEDDEEDEAPKKKAPKKEKKDKKEKRPEHDEL